MGEIDPDEIFIDSSNLPQFDVYQFEGRLEQPISRRSVALIVLLFIGFGGVFLSRFWFLQIYRGQAFADRSEQNRLHDIDIFANRGVIFDRNGVELASNDKYETDENGDESDFAKRVYAPIKGIAHVVGYVKYPTKDSSGFYFRNSYVGEDGIEKVYHDILSGKNGVQVVETDALGRVQSKSKIEQPKDGQSVTLTIDSRLNAKLYEIMSQATVDYGFTGGAAVMMDVHNGDLIDMVSFPEYDPSKMAEGDKTAIDSYMNDSRNPFLNRVVSGLYTPGSIVKPIIALGALTEKVINPDKKILSTGSISIPNPYFPDLPSIFRDWRPQGWINMREALAVSSDVYFYEVGGGFQDQKGLGILNIDKYLRMFGIGSKTGINLSDEKVGTIPTPDWKEKNFPGDPWRIGDTYHTAIGQYGVQFTPIQVVRYISAIANSGTLLTPRLVHTNDQPDGATRVPIAEENFQIVREGMHGSAHGGTAAGINVSFVDMAGKTGTAELGSLKQYVNSWVVGFFPYENPKYAFAVMMEKGPRGNLIGATYVMRQLLDWMHDNTPEYFQ